MGNGNLIKIDTAKMNEWGQEAKNHTEDYDWLISELYDKIQSFTGSEEFSGSLSEAFMNQYREFQPKFESFSEDYRVYQKVMQERESNATDAIATSKAKIDGMGIL